MNRFAKRKRAEQRKWEQEAEELEREAIEEEKLLKQRHEMVEEAQPLALIAVPQEEYEAAKEAAGWFEAIWNEPGRDRKPILAFMIRRIASGVESSFLAKARSASVEDAASNVTGALFGGFDGAASTAQMAVQQADMRYRIARMAADNLYQLAQEIERMDTDPYPDLIEHTKDAALRVRKMGLSLENVSLLIATADDLVCSAYGLDMKSLNELDALEQKREEAFREHWIDNRHRLGMERYDIAGRQYYRQLFHKPNPT